MKHNKAKVHLIYDLSLAFLTTGMVLGGQFVGELMRDIGFRYFYFFTFLVPVIGFFILYRTAQKIDE